MKRWLKLTLWAIGSLVLLVVSGLVFLNYKYLPTSNVYVDLQTKWAADVSSDKVLKEYPRPQMVRSNWKNLNGIWQYAIRPKNKDKPEKFDGEILVPFAVESQLSGVKKRVGKDSLLWYQKTFEVTNLKERLLLHFGAVDWHATVWINGKKIGEHKGGHDPFSFDITAYLKPSKKQNLVVSVWDPTDEGFQPRGKQVKVPQSIYYTPVTGIWQTVWLEPVPQRAIERLSIVPDIDNGWVNVSVMSNTFLINDSIRVLAMVKDSVVAKSVGLPNSNIKLILKDPQLWSPNSPFLYDLKIELRDREIIIDSVSSYFGMREISKKKDPNGIWRIYLNNEPIFQYGLLDQGWWPDGLYTAPTDEALKYDIIKTREMGFNMIRKHVKVEPARWYYHCDRIGMLVWQDMPTGDQNAIPPSAMLSEMISQKSFGLDAWMYATLKEDFAENYSDIKRTVESEQIFYTELEEMIRDFQTFPSIVVWVLFNESWGQFDTNKVIERLRELDSTRLIDGTSGWIDRGESDIRDYHIYNIELQIPRWEANRPVVIGEFGGLGHSVKGHLGVKDPWSYKDIESRQKFKEAYTDLIKNQLIPLIPKGLSAAVYTQTTDVESEINGLITYDRKVDKINPVELRKLHGNIYETFETSTNHRSLDKAN